MKLTSVWRPSLRNSFVHWQLSPQILIFWSDLLWHKSCKIHWQCEGAGFLPKEWAKLVSCNIPIKITDILKGESGDFTVERAPADFTSVKISQRKWCSCKVVNSLLLSNSYQNHVIRSWEFLQKLLWRSKNSFLNNKVSKWIQKCGSWEDNHQKSLCFHHSSGKCVFK